MKKVVKNQKGFTLIELVIVVAVLAIIAVVAVPVVGGIINDANASTDQANLALYQVAIERWAAEPDNDGAYPESLDKATEAVEKYTNTSPEAPKQSGDYKYWYNSTNGNIKLSNEETEAGYIQWLPEPE